MAKKKVQSGIRRSNGEGSIFQRKDGRWVGAVSAGYDEEGKIIRKTVYGKSRAEVAQKVADLTKRISNNNFDYIETHTLGEMMEEWLLVFKKMMVSPRTFEGCVEKFRLHIQPKIGNMKIYEINSMVVQKLLNDMLEEKYSLDMVRKTKSLINQFFEYAIENKLTNENPAARAKVKTADRKIYDGENRYKAIPPDVRNKFLNALEEHTFLKSVCYCMFFAGLRAGEVLALSWEDIDFGQKTIHVRRGITTLPKFDENGKVKERVTVISDTKTACSVRDVPMPYILIDALQKWKDERYIVGREHDKNLITNTSLVFGNNDGSVRTYHGTKKIFENFLKKHELDKYGIHFHGLRHTYSNMLFESGQNPKVIQGLLGHKSVKTTITTYNSVDKTYFQKAVDGLNNEFKPETLKQNIEKEKQEKEVSNLSLDELDILLETLRKQKEEKELEEENERKRKRKEKDFEM